MGCGRSCPARGPPKLWPNPLEVLKQAVAIVSAKSPADAAAFKGWLQHISQALLRPWPKEVFSGLAA
jgi:hypothetical protein